MGITASDIELIQLALRARPSIKTVCELGSQNLYREHDDRIKPPFASEYYQEIGLTYACIDMAGDNDAMRADLSYPIMPTKAKFDLVTDFGTSEHVVQCPVIQTVKFHDGHINSIYPSKPPTEAGIQNGFFECWKNKHRLLMTGGMMINVNPKTGNWPEHGYTYISKDFYLRLSELVGYSIVWLNENSAMGNPQAINIECVLMKAVDSEFCSFQEFQTCEQFRS